MTSWKVLVVDDDTPTRSLLHALLGHNGHRCTGVGDAREALELLKPGSFDVVLLDLLLPEFDGFDVLRAMKETHPEMLSRTIVMTAAAERTYAGRAELDNVWRVLRKPIEIAEVADEIDQCAQQRPRNERRSPARVDPHSPSSQEEAG